MIGASYVDWHVECIEESRLSRNNQKTENLNYYERIKQHQNNDRDQPGHTGLRAEMSRERPGHGPNDRPCPRDASGIAESSAPPGAQAALSQPAIVASRATVDRRNRRSGGGTDAGFFAADFGGGISASG
jgi:hypothetical protein